jgi:beta-lactam-binding protein with PASTA domain
MGKRILIYLVAGIGTIAGIALLFNLFMTLFVGGRQVTVPDIRGLREDDAGALLRESGLKNEVLGEEFSMEYPESTVSTQNPPAGQVVKQGRKIVTMMSKGGEFRDVPYCVGKPLRTARIILERSGLIVGNISRVSKSRGYPEEVLSTEPLPGSKVVRGSLVNILVNEGTRRAKMLMPDLRRKSYLAVKMKLEQLGLFVQESSLDERFNPLRSRVVLHAPPAGHVVARGDTVTLIISTAQDDDDRSL